MPGRAGGRLIRGQNCQDGGRKARAEARRSLRNEAWNYEDQQEKAAGGLLGPGLLVLFQASRLGCAGPAESTGLGSGQW